MYEVCSKLTIKTPEWRYQYPPGAYITNFEQVLHIGLVFHLIILNK